MHSTPSLVFDVAHALNLGSNEKRRRPQSTVELPAPTEGFVTLTVPRGLTFEAVRTSPVGQEQMKHQEWYLNQPWYKQPLPGASVWLFRKLQDSLGKRTMEIRGLMGEKEGFPHIGLALATVLCLRQRYTDPLQGLFLTVGPHQAEYVLQIASQSKVEIIVHRDVHDALSIAAAAMPVR